MLEDFVLNTLAALLYKLLSLLFELEWTYLLLGGGENCLSVRSLLRSDIDKFQRRVLVQVHACSYDSLTYGAICNVTSCEINRPSQQNLVSS